ncbi:MAG: hypothetical protein AAF591_20115 [Verrucomicrobiota bacterium]
MGTGKEIEVVGVELEFLPVETRVPLKFGAQVLERVICARARVRVRRLSDGWEKLGIGETPLSVPWVWPGGDLSYGEKERAMVGFCELIAERLPGAGLSGHAMELGYDFIEEVLPELVEAFSGDLPEGAELPELAALVCFSLFDLAIHDGYGVVHGVKTYETYTGEWMERDLADFVDVAKDMRGGDLSFAGKYPGDFLVAAPADGRIPVWHLVGGLDALEKEDLTGDASVTLDPDAPGGAKPPDDGYPFYLRDWIRTDGLKCLKVKLRGNDEGWDYERLVKIGRIAAEEGVDWLSTDFNCTVTDPEYVNGILDRLKGEERGTWDKILYVEQPFPYDLEANRIEVGSVSERKPLFLDESAHDWRYVRLGRELGWTGVALKTCKTQTGALLSLCWAKAHGMDLMVQDLTNPMLAQVPHVLLGAHAGTIMGVESNGMQFYPEASVREAAVHPGLYRRREGVLDFSTLEGAGFGYGAALR